MAANSIKSVPFNEGAPLDPNALNQLREDILTTYTTSNNLFNNFRLNCQSKFCILQNTN